jgi:hypothetical protein
MADLDLFGAFDENDVDVDDLVSSVTAAPPSGKRKAEDSSSAETAAAAVSPSPSSSAPPAKSARQGDEDAGEGKDGMGGAEPAPFVIGGVSKVHTVTAYDDSNGDRKACRHEIAIPPGMPAPDIMSLTSPAAVANPAKVRSFPPVAVEPNPGPRLAFLPTSVARVLGLAQPCCSSLPCSAVLGLAWPSRTSLLLPKALSLAALLDPPPPLTRHTHHPLSPGLPLRA